MGKFEYKSGVKFADYVKHLGLTETTFSELDAEKQAEHMIDFNEGMNDLRDSMIENKASKEDLKAIQNEINENIAKQMTALNAALKEQGVALRKLHEGEKVHRATSVKEAIEMGLKENAEKLKTIANRDGAFKSTDVAGAGFAFKAAGTMSITSNVTGELPQAELIPGLNAIASRQVRLLDLVSRGRTQSNLIKWAYQANKDGSAGQTGEGVLKNQIDFDILLGSEDVVKTTAFIKVTDEMIEDIDFMASEINNELLRELLKAVEAGVYSGDGTGNNLHGIYDVATAFAAGTFAGTVDNANIVDVLNVAVNQIAIAEQGAPTAILMHPSDVTSLKMAKVSSTDKRYVENLFMVGSQLSLAGIPIIPTTLVTQDEYLVGDFSRAFVLDRSDINIEVGLDSDDFTKNLRTVRAEWRGVCFVKNNDRTAFVKGDFSTDAAVLETA